MKTVRSTSTKFLDLPNSLSARKVDLEADVVKDMFVDYGISTELIRERNH